MNAVSTFPFGGAGAPRATKGVSVMDRDSLSVRLEKGLRLLAGVGLALLLFQCAGVLTYALTVWPKMLAVPSAGITFLGAAAVGAALARSALWVRIYWTGARALQAARTTAEAELPARLSPILGALTRLLVASCALDVLLLPAIFLMDRFFPFTLSSVQLGMIQVAAICVPQAFGLTALVLAYLAHQYARLVRERCEMKSDLALTI
jgi:hypothetical protein